MENKLLKELFQAKEQIIQQGQEMLCMKESEIGRLQREKQRLEAENKQLAEELAQEKEGNQRLAQSV